MQTSEVMRDINYLIQCRPGFCSDEEWTAMDIEDLAIVADAFAKTLHGTAFMVLSGIAFGF